MEGGGKAAGNAGLNAVVGSGEIRIGGSAGGDGDVKVNWETEVEADAVSEN